MQEVRDCRHVSAFRLTLIADLETLHQQQHIRTAVTLNSLSFASTPICERWVTGNWTTKLFNAVSLPSWARNAAKKYFTFVRHLKP